MFDSTDTAKITSVDNIIAIVPVIGFAIQKTMEILDPIILDPLTKKIKKRLNSERPEADIKKAITGIFSTILGMIIASHTQIQILTGPNDWLNFFLTGLVIGAGTEGVNIATKYFQYLKDSKKPQLSASQSAPEAKQLSSPSEASEAKTQLPTEVILVPLVTTLDSEVSCLFKPIVNNNKDISVDLRVLQSNGGEITSNTDGTYNYTAPSQPGIYQILAISKADPSKTAVATVTVK
jgi:hypothetical protein